MKKVIILLFMATATAGIPSPKAEAHSACHKYDYLLKAHGLPVGVFSRIMFRESGCQPQARNVNRNGTVDRGLLQLNSIHLKPGGVADGYARAQLYIPEINIKLAARLYKRSGMRPWRLN